MTSRLPLLVVLASLVLPCCFLADARERPGRDTNNAFEALKKKYEWGSIYVMYRPLLGIRYHLGNDDNIERLAPPHIKENLRLLRKFVGDSIRTYMSESVAFLQLNLQLEKAGFKKIEDTVGTILVLPWTKEEFRDIAVYCDEFLNRDDTATNMMKSFSEGKSTLREGYILMKKLANDPYVPTTKVPGLVGAYRELIDKRPQELQFLQKGNDQKMYKNIMDFREDFDKFGKQLRDNPKFQSLLKKSKENAWEKDFIDIQKLELEMTKKLIENMSPTLIRPPAKFGKENPLGTIQDPTKPFKIPGMKHLVNPP